VIGATSPVGGNVTSMLLDQLVKEVNIGQVPLKGGKVSHFLKLGAILREYDFEKPETVEELYNNIDVVCLTIDIDPKVSSTIDQFIEPLHKYIDTIKLLVVSIRGGNFIELKDTQLSKMMLANEEKIKSIGIPYVIIRHALEFESLMQFNTKLIRFHRTIATPLSTLNWVSAYDVANCIVNCIYKQSENYGKIYEITALEQQTAEYFSSCLSKSIGESVTHVEIEMDEMLEFFCQFRVFRRKRRTINGTC